MAHGRTKLLHQLDAARVEIDERNVLFSRDLFRGLDVIDEVRSDATCGREIPTGQRCDEDRLRTGRARFVDIAGHVRAKRGNVGLAIEALTGLVVVSEL